MSKTTTIKTPKDVKDLGITEAELSEAVLKKLAKELYMVKQQKSAIESQHRKYDKAVKKVMDKLGLKDYDFGLILDKRKCTLHLGYEETVRNVVDVRALAKLLKSDKEKFFDIISATQTKVDAELGSTVTKTILIEEEGTPTFKMQLNEA